MFFPTITTFRFSGSYFTRIKIKYSRRGSQILEKLHVLLDCPGKSTMESNAPLRGHSRHDTEPNDTHLKMRSEKKLFDTTVSIS